MNKKIFMLLFFMLVLISISTVSAVDLDDNNNTIVSSADTKVLALENDATTINDLNENYSDGDDKAFANYDKSVAVGKNKGNDLLSSDNDENGNILKAGEGTFLDLENEINSHTSEYVKLEKDIYRYKDKEEPIYISRSVTIDGNGATIDLAGSSRVFSVGNTDVIIKNLIIKNANFNPNTQQSESSAIYFLEYSGGSVENCTFVNNTARYGSAISFESAFSGSVENCTFMNNIANSNGGAIYITSTDCKINKCTFVNNTALNGGAIYFQINCDNSIVENCTFVNNTATIISSAIYFASPISSFNDNWWGSNNLNWNNLTTKEEPSSYAVFNGTADTQNINSSSKAKLNYTFYRNGTSNILSLPKRAITLSTTGGDLDDTSGYLINGEFLTEFSADNSGEYIINATVDNQKLQLTIHVTSTEPKTIYVNATAASGGNGKSKETAFQTLQDALNVALYGDTIMIASGTYTGNDNTGLLINNDYLNLVKYGDGEAIFDGELNTTSIFYLVSINDPTILNIKGLTFKNAKDYAIVYNGFARMIINSSINATFINIGSAIYAKSANNVNITGTFINNTAGDELIKIQNANNVVIHDSIFINNGAKSLFNINGQYQIYDNWFGNTADDYYIAPAGVTNVEMISWLFLNATANPIKPEIGKNSTIIFELYNYSDSEAIKKYDRPMNIQLDLTQSLGKLDKTAASLSEEITYTANEVGYGNVTATFKTATYTIHLKNIGPKEPTEIIVKNETMNLKVNNETPVGATLNPPVGNLTYTSSNESVVKVENGMIKALAKGNSTVTVSFAGNDEYAAAEKTINVTVELNDASVSAENMELYVGENATVNYHTVPDKLNVIFIPDNSGRISIYNGVVTALKEGIASVIVKVGGDGVYAENSTKFTVNVSKNPSEIIVVNDTITMNYGDELDNIASLKPSDAGNLTYVISDESVIKVVNNTLIAVDVGQATVTVSFTGNEKYAAAENKTITVTVNEEKPEINTTITENIKIYDKNVTVMVVLPEDATGEVMLAIDGELVNQTGYKLINGSASISIPSDLLIAGRHSYLVTYNGDDNYLNTFDYEPFEVEKLTPTITIEGLAGNVGDVLNVNVTVTGLEDRIPTGYILATEEGVPYILNQGVAHVELTLYEAGQTAFNVSYSGDDNYNKNQTSKTFTVGKAATSVEISGTNNINVGDNATLTITVTPKGVTGNVNIIVDGELNNETFNLLNGTVIIEITDLAYGIHNISAQYNGDANYNASDLSNNFTITVNKIDVSDKIAIDGSTVVYGNNATVTVELPEDAKGTITITINNNTYTGNVDGKITVIEIPDLAANIYELFAVEYSGDNKYENHTGMATIKVTPATSSIVIEDILDAAYPGSVQIDYKVVNETNLTITIRDANGKEITKGIKNETNRTIITGLETGKYTVTITNAAEGNYSESVATKEFNVIKGSIGNINLNITGDLVVNSKINVTFSLPIDINSSSVIAYIDGVYTIPDLIDGTGNWIIEFDSLDAGNHTVFVMVTGDKNYNDAYRNITFEIKKINPTITIEGLKGNVGDTIDVTVTISGLENRTPTGYILATEEGIPYILNQGVAHVELTLYEAGQTAFNVSYSGDDNYNKNQTSKTFTVDKAATSVEISGTNNINVGDNATITITVTPKGVTGNVNIIVDGELNKETFNLLNGTVIIEISDLTYGIHNIAAQYNGDTNYNASNLSDNFTITVNKIDVSDKIAINGGTVVYGNNATVTVELPEDAKGTITVTINNNTYTANVDGKITEIEIPNLAADIYELFAVEYSGDNKYENHTGMATIKVTPATSSIVIEDILDAAYPGSVQIDYNVVNETNLTITIRDANGKEITKGIKNETNRTIITGLETGKYTVTITNAAEGNYSESVATKEFNVIKGPIGNINLNITGDLVVNSKINATFSLPIDINSSSVIAYIDGVYTIPDLIDGTGNWIIKFDSLDAGNHTVFVMVTGDKNYNDAYRNITFEIKKINPTITIERLKGNVGDTINVTVTISGNGTNPTSYIIVNSISYELNETSQANFTLNLETAGNITLDVIYVGDDNYNKNQTSKTFTVGKTATSVEISGTDSINVGDNATITVTVTPNKVTGNINIFVDGESLEPVELNNGVARIEITDLTNGAHNITAKYNGDDNYNASDLSDNFTITVNKIDVSDKIAIKGSTVVYGNNATVTVELPEDATGNVTVTLLNIEGRFNGTVEFGSAIVELPILNVGEYAIDKVYYSGDDKYLNWSEPSFALPSVTVNPASSSVVIENILDVEYPDSIYVNYKVENVTTVTIVVRDADGNEVTKGVSNKTHSVIILADAGKYTITVSNAKEGNYYESSAEATFNILKGHTSINLNVTGDLVVDGKINVTFPLNSYVNSSCITAYIDGAYVVDLDNESGNYVISFDNLDAGNHTVFVILSGDKNYNDAYGNITFEVKKINPTITISPISGKVRDIVDVNVTVSGPGNITPTGYIISDYGTYILDQGFTQIPLDLLITGKDLLFIVSYSGDENYNIGDGEVFYNVSKADSTIVINGPSEIKVGEDAEITVEIPDSGKVTLWINDEVYGTFEFDSTSGSILITSDKLPYGTYTITAQYLENINYNASEKESIQLNVSKIDVSKIIEMEGSEVVYGEPAYIFVSHLPVNATGIVTAIINGKPYTGEVDSGLTTIEIPNLAAGNYNLVGVTYSGDDKYNAASGMVDITVKQASSTVEIIPCEDAVYPGDVGIIFKVLNATTVTVIAMNEKGVVVFNETEDINRTIFNDTIYLFDLSAGKYYFKMHNAETENFTSSQNQISFVVNKAKPEVETTITSDIITVVLPKDATGKVMLLIDGEIVSQMGYDLINGSANIKVPSDFLTVGRHSYLVSYMGDDNYAFSEGYETFDISNKYASNIVIYGVEDSTYPGEINIGFTVENATTVTVTVIYDNSTVVYNNIEVVDKAEFSNVINLSGLSAGKYLISVYNEESHLYTDYLAEVMFIVNKAEPFIDTTMPDEIKPHQEGVILNVVLPKDATGNVMLTIDGEIVSQMGYVLINGTANIAIPSDFLNAGKHSYIVSYEGDDNYTSAVSYSIFNVDAEPSEVNITIPTGFKVGEEANITVDIPGATGDVNIIVDGIETIVPLDENGTAVLPINVTPGEHSVVVVYSGDDAHSPVVKTTTFAAVVVPTKFDNVTVKNDLNITAILIDSMGDAVANATITYTIGNVTNSIITNANGEFTIPGVAGETITIDYAGDDVMLPTTLTLTLSDVVPELVETYFNIPGGVITLNGYAVDTKAGEHGMTYATELLDSKGKPVTGVKIQFAVNDKIYDRTTDEKGSFTPYKLDMIRAGRYTMAFFFAGDEKYTSAFGSVCVDLDKKPITIKASAKTYKASTKTKSYTVTLSTIVGSSSDGKAHLSTKKVTLKVNGKTYTGKTNAKGQATFKLTNLSKKGVYSAVISFAGDITYESATKSVKLTIK